ncbi:Facilitated trehalose transporter Tret1-2 homolog [Gryllus bimaculatus]|nr:Facilitated trehalose transporter Tret1-2 homolog [Gryllus bimaculatus]
MRQRPLRAVSPQVLAAVVAASFHLAVGVALAFSAVLIPQIEAPGSDIQVTASDSSWLASALVLVVPVGALLAGGAMEWLGRLNTVAAAALPCAAGWVLIATAPDVTSILIGRLLTGVAAGLGTSAGVVYITEVAKPELRGSLISICPSLASLGMLIVYGEGAVVGWRAAAWTSLAYVLLPVLPVLLWLPESPSWLVAKGRTEDAERALAWLTGKQAAAVKQQVASMVKSQDVRAAPANTMRVRLDTFLQPCGYKPLLILFGLFLIQQFSGIYITLFYAVNFFKDVGSSFDPRLATVLVGAARFTMSLCNTGLLKRFGRRPLCMVSGLGMAACMGVSGYFTLHLRNGGEHGAWVPVACVLLYVCTSMIGFLNIPWTMTAELFPTEIRGIAHGIVISVAHLIMFGAVWSYRSLLLIFGGPHGVQWFFAANSLFGTVFVWLFLPETHKVSLNDIQDYFFTNTIYITKKKKKQYENSAQNMAHSLPLMGSAKA